MLSTARNRRWWWRRASAISSPAVRSADFERYRIDVPLRPQNMQCERSPHQQPRALSNGISTSGPSVSPRPDASSRAKYSS